MAENLEHSNSHLNHIDYIQQLKKGILILKNTIKDK